MQLAKTHKFVFVAEYLIAYHPSYVFWLFSRPAFEGFLQKGQINGNCGLTLSMLEHRVLKLDIAYKW